MKPRNTLILALVVAALGAFVWFYEIQGAEKRSEEESASKRIFHDLKADAIEWIELRTDGVLRSPTAKEYNAGHRLYGLVNSNLMWAMDMAAVGEPLQSHVSAELKRVG